MARAGKQRRKTQKEKTQKKKGLAPRKEAPGAARPRKKNAGPALSRTKTPGTPIPPETTLQSAATLGATRRSRTLRDVCYALEPGDWTALWQRVRAWPPNMFALTSLLLAATEAYRLVVSPPQDCVWPQCEDPDSWHADVADVASTWRQRWENNPANPPERIGTLGASIQANLDRPISDFRDGAVGWQACHDLLELHAIADEACIGLGIPYTPDQDIMYRVEAQRLLTRTGSLAEFSPEVIRVLPKLRTPQVGITLRSLSHHAAVDLSGIGVDWQIRAGLCPDIGGRLNLLLVPWPFEIDERDFIPSEGSLKNMNSDHFGFFKFEPQSRFTLAHFKRILAAAKQLSPTIHGVVFPETALTEPQVRAVQRFLHNEVGFMLAGVRAERENYARLAFFASGSSVDQPFVDQHKHHRWAVERSQIKNYKLDWVLNPGRWWWEDIRIHPRTIHFVCANPWLSICHLICEDLARVDPVAQVIRAVGPTLVLALLQDGPQLAKRWSARYATVLADDPGSSVLTLTSLGMALRSTPQGEKPSRSIAVWKDPRGGVRELALDEGAQAMLVTLCAEWATEWTADGRSDDNAAAHLILADHKSVKV